MSRNHPPTFAANTRANLNHIGEARVAGDNTVHEVTQIANSMLGLIIFPFERKTIPNRIKKLKLYDLVKQGWPCWTFETGSETETLGCLIHHLRNAAAHGKMRFCGNNKDSPNPAEVLIVVKDWPSDADEAKAKTKAKYWKASILASKLRTFCEHLGQLLDAPAHAGSCPTNVVVETDPLPHNLT